MMPLSNHQLPPPLMTSEIGSFAQRTITERKPEIIRRVIADNDYPPDIIEALHQFVNEIASKPIAPLRENTEDSSFWNTQWSKYAGKTWLEIPWYFAETYFYRRLLEILGYLQPGKFYKLDPFNIQKVSLENSALDQLRSNWLLIEKKPIQERFIYLLHASLWGNRADLSNFTVKENAHQGIDTHILRQHIIINHTQRVHNYLRTGVQTVVFINDNVGADSLCDLFLADFLLTHSWVQTVVFHLKNQPFFVSDAMPTDIQRIIHKLKSMPGTLIPLGKRLIECLQNGKLQLTTDPFWVSSLTFNQIPEPLCSELSQADLIILKGDVNYRRLLDDRHWAPITKVEKVTKQFPKPFLLLRTLKGEIIVGLAKGQAKEIAIQDPTWLINGKRGIIQFVKA